MVRVLVGVLVASLITLQAGAAHARAGAAGKTGRSGPGRWTRASPLPVPVSSQVAVLLGNGNVLVVGGEATEYGMPTHAVQIYHPAENSWSPARPMVHGRIGQTATVLLDGRVLVAGGLGRKLQALASAEIYDPALNTWTATAPMPQTRFSQSASLLGNGDVLIVGGIVQGTISRSTLLFDPVAGTWKSGPPTNAPHGQQDSLTLPDGRVLIAGGYGGPPEIYDPSHGTWTVAGTLRFRSHPILVTVADGTALYTSGAGPRGHGIASSLLFDPGSDRWVKTAPMGTRRDQPIGVELGDGSVLVAGGSGPRLKMLRSAQIYDDAEHTWRATAPMREARSAATAVRLSDGRVLVCGGSYYGAVLDSCELYVP